MAAFFAIALPSLAAGVLLGVLLTAHRRRPQDRFTRIAEAEVYGDVPHIEPGDVHHTGFRKQFQQQEPRA